MQQAAGFESLVADELGGQAQTGLAGEQDVIGIARHQFGADGGGLPVGGRGNDQALDVFHVPVVVHEFDGQPVQQLGVGRLVALGAEVFGGEDDTAAEQL